MENPTMDGLLERTVEEVSTGAVFALLPDAAQAAVRQLPAVEVREAARRTLTRPIPGDTSQGARLLLNPCLAVQWLATFETLNLPRSLRVFEPCAGSGEPVILATEIYSDGEGRYTTVNLNRPLAGALRAKLGKLRIPVQIVEDDATRAGAAGAPASVDVACFHHAINDLLQTAVSEARGLDTRAIDWWVEERGMIEWLAEDYAAGRLDEHARPALLAAVRHAALLVRPGGFLLFDHWTWEAHHRQEWFPWQLFCDIIPLARAWIGEAPLPLEEVPLPGRDPRWWMAFRVLPNG